MARSIVLFFALLLPIFATTLKKDTTYTIAFSQDTLENSFRLKQLRVIEDALSHYKNINFIYSNAKSNSALQVKQIEDFINQGVDLIMASPYDEEATAYIISKAYQSGIPVVMVERSIQGDDYTTYIHPDNEKIAIDAAKYLVKKMNFKGSVLLLKGIPQADVTRKRTEGFYKVLNNYPNIKVLEYTANYLGRDAIVGVEKLLNEGKHFDAIMSQSDGMLIGARLALKSHNIDPSSLVTVGIGYITPAQEAIRYGQQSSSYVYSLCAKESAKAAVAILSGEKVPKEIVINSAQVTKENVEDVMPIF